MDRGRETGDDGTLLKRTERPVKMGVRIRGKIRAAAPIFRYPAVEILHLPTGMRRGTRRVISGKAINKPKPTSKATRKGMSER